MNLARSRAVVTGGAGFIGSHVVDALVAGGTEVVVVDDLSVGSRANLAQHEGSRRLRLEVADVRDEDAMFRIVRDADVVIHMAVASLRVSLSDPVTVDRINTGGTLNVCRAAQRNGVARLLYVSSSEAYGSAVRVPMAESHPLVPTTVYGATKAAGELYALAFLRTYGLEVSVVRPFNTYGPREHAEGTSAEVIPRFVYRALSGRSPIVFGTGEQTRDFTWVEDTARGIVLATACDALVGDTVNIAYGREVSIGEIGRLVLARIGRPDLPLVQDEARPGDVSRHYADITKAGVLLGYAPTVDIGSGISRYVDWVVEQRPALEEWVAREPVRNW